MGIHQSFGGLNQAAGPWRSVFATDWQQLSRVLHITYLPPENLVLELSGLEPGTCCLPEHAVMVLPTQPCLPPLPHAVR